MRAGKKILLIVVGLTLLLAVIGLMLRRRSEQSVATSVANAPDGTFLIRVERPALSGRPIWESPKAIFFGETDPRLNFSDMSPGAKIGSVTPTHLEIIGDGGWGLVIESDSQGRTLAGTRLAFPLTLGDRQLKLDCRPADAALGNFNAIARRDQDRLDGSFLLKLGQCKNAVSGKNTAGLPVFTVRGSFKGLPRTNKMVEE
jgi:hypothetical protein